MAHRVSDRATTGAQFALEADDAEALHALGHHRTFRRGQRLVFEGTAAGHVVIVESGRVKVVITTIDGDEKILAVRGPGEILGDLSVVSGDCATASVVTLEEVKATILAGSRYLEFLQQRPSLMLGQMRRLIDSLRETNQLLIEQSSTDVGTRVARRLVDLTRHGSEHIDGHIVITTQLSQEELAGMCGASRESVARALKDLRDHGVITTDRRRIVILDAESLHART